MSLTDQILLCEVHSIVTILYDDATLVVEKERLSGALGILPSNIYDLEQRSSNDSFRFLTLMLHNWISKDGRLATRERLINVLKNEGFVNVSEKLEILFEHDVSNIQQCETDTVWFDMREDVNGFTGREEILTNLHKALTEQRNKRITVITTLHGLGGIGKTTLAVRYAWLYRENKFYQHVVWINAETPQTINDSFNRLAEQLSLSTVDKRSKQLDLRQIVCKIYGHFNGKRNTLFILDNATDYESIEKCLPPPKTPDVTPPFVLLTSRHTKWGDSVNAIPLDVFSEVESVEFFKNYLTLDTESEISLARRIAGMLENLPLAVRQAGAYIKMQTGLDLTMEESLEEYITKFMHKSEELLGFEHWIETKDRNYEKTTLLTWDLTLEKVRKENEHTEVIMHIIAYLSPDNIPTQLFESLILNPKDDTVQYITWLERFRSLCGCKVESNLPHITLIGFNILPAIKLLADYSMINTQTSFRRNMFSVHRLVQRVVRIQIERAHEFSKLRDCVQLFETHFHSNNSSYEAEILIHAETLTDNIKESKLSSVYEGFIQLVKRKLENLLEKQISLFENMIDAKEYEQAFEMSRNPQLFGSNVPVYKMYLRGTFEIILEHIKYPIESANLEIIAKVFTHVNQPYFLALYGIDTIEDDLWRQYGFLLSRCFNLCDQYKNEEHFIGKLTRQLVEYCSAVLVHLKRILDLAVIVPMTKGIISWLDDTPDNESRKLWFIREVICAVEEHAKQNSVAFVKYSLVSIIELMEYIQPHLRRRVRVEFIKVLHDIFIYSTSRLEFLMLLKVANGILLCFQRFREYDAIHLILKEVILTIDSTSEHNSHSTVSEIQTMATIIYKVTFGKYFRHNTDLYSQLLHICQLNYNAIRDHSIFLTAGFEASMILKCFVALRSDVLEIVEFSRKYVDDFGYHGTGSPLRFEVFKSMNGMIEWFERLKHETTGLRQENEKYNLLLHESLKISESYFEKIQAFENTNLKCAYLALNALKVRIDCILSLEKISRTSPLHSLSDTLNKPEHIYSELEEVFRTGINIKNPDSFKQDVLKYLELIEMEIVSLDTIPPILELALVDIMRLSAEIKNLSRDFDGALGKLKVALNPLNTTLADNPKSSQKFKSVTLKIKNIRKAMKEAYS